MTKKLAVLISGSYRNFDQVWDKNKAVIEELKVPYEVFFHTWSQNPSSKSSALELLYKNEILFAIKKPILTPYKYEVITKEACLSHDFFSLMVEDFNESEVCREFNLDLNPTNFLVQSQINSCGMYIGIERLRQELTKHSGFSHFLRLRTDFELDPNSLSNLFTHDLVFFGQLLNTPEGPIGDQCFGGQIPTGGGILSTIDELRRHTSSIEWKANPVQGLGETVIRLTLSPMRRNLNIHYADGKGKIKRPDFEYVSFFQEPFYWFKIFGHNIAVLMKKIRSKVTNLI
jgi:hypothetical protein